MPFNEDVRWVCFDGVFDFPYLLKLLTNDVLPEIETDFYKELKLYFPWIYDVKHLLKDLEDLKRKGLNYVAEKLNVTIISWIISPALDSKIRAVASRWQ